MILSQEQTANFYKLWFPLLKFVNVKTSLISNLTENPTTGALDISEAVVLRNALWENEELLDQFISDNPAKLSTADLEIVANWHNKLRGNFFIFRHLKKYSIFLSVGSPSRAYGVLGLYSPLQEIVGPQLPVYVKAVLLPFAGQIIIDGLLEGYNVYFGSGIRANLQDAYRAAQEREGIITRLEPPSANPAYQHKEMLDRNSKLLKNFEKDLAVSNLSLNKIQQHRENVEQFGRGYLLAQEPPRQLLDLTLTDLQTYLSLPGQASSRVSLRRFVRFLYNTDRIDPDRATALNSYLKSAD